MKVIFLRFFFLLSLIVGNIIISKADGGPNIPIINVPTDDNDDDNGPHHAPIHHDVYAVLNRTDQTLSLFVSSPVVICSVEIYKDGNLIISDPIPTLYYMLSSYGNGDYTILATTNNGIVYTGIFTI